MRLAKIIGAVGLAVFAIGTMVADASAHQFNFNTVGLFTVKAHGPSLFRFPPGEIVCTTFAGHGKLTALKLLTIVVTVQYKNCTSALGVVAEPINLDYEFSADETVSILKDVTINITAAGVKCAILVLPQSGLKTVTYTNVGDGILLAARIKGILSDGAGAACIGGSWTDDKNGEYNGSALIGLVGGTMSWG